MAAIPDKHPFTAEDNPMDDDHDSARHNVIWLLYNLLHKRKASDLESEKDRLLDISIAFSRSNLPEDSSTHYDHATALSPRIVRINGTRTIAIQTLGEWIPLFRLELMWIIHPMGMEHVFRI